MSAQRAIPRALQGLLADIYDVPVACDVGEFLLTDNSRLPPQARASGADEQVLVAEDADTVWVSVYLEPALLQRLASANPLECLHGGNIADYWTVLEGVSHFVYLAWNAVHDRAVTLLELELQGEIDKYVSSIWLLRQQNPGHFPAELHHLLFERASLDSALAGDRLDLYRRANFYAARFCRRLARTLRPTESSARADAIAELRRFYRLGRDRKVHHIESLA